ncbi:hypothetical protein SLEP1_g51474 [Rubroshorea leprosula]|uniref:Ribosomal protein L16 n=1 Tax=Rubroshorea leprosula TaxID=152421 RepID=A0AAV5M437_9ROSI|nr:hypothetical protein SLEP1_g51474 [Rubroshorea leprosula]
MPHFLSFRLLAKLEIQVLINHESVFLKETKLIVLKVQALMVLKERKRVSTTAE